MARALAVHADYRCHHSGACCSSGWDVPVEAPLEDRLRAALRSGHLRLPQSGSSGSASPAAACFKPVSALPDAARSVLVYDRAGRCLFLASGGAGRCAIHRQLGEEALPVACREFPRVTTLTPLGVSLTLSHYCPSAARLLFQAEGTGDGPDPLLRIRHDPPAFPSSRVYQGLEARQEPPLLRPGVLMSWAGHEAWEAHAVAILALLATPEAALERLAADAERLRRWTPAAGDFDRYLADTLATAGGEDPHPRRIPGPFEAWDEVSAAVPASPFRSPDPRAEVATGAADPAASLVAAGWPSLGVPVRRWLAAKAFASWLALQGDGVRTQVVGLWTALGVLRAEASRGCREAGRPLDPELLREAFRRSDLLLVHLVDPEALASRLSRCERGRVLRS